MISFLRVSGIEKKVQGVQLCILGKSGLGATADRDERDSHCIPNKKDAKSYKRSDFTRCSNMLVDALLGYGVAPATSDYTNTIVDRLCATDFRTLGKPLKVTLGNSRFCYKQEHQKQRKT